MMRRNPSNPVPSRRISESGQIHLAIVRGLITVAIIIAGGIVALLAFGKTVQPELYMVLSADIGGLAGFLGGHAKHQNPDQNTSVTTEHVGTMNVETPAPNPAEGS